MKKLNILLSGLLLAGLGFTSCNDEQDMPPVTFPEGVQAEGEPADSVHIGTGTWDNPYEVWQVQAGVELITDNLDWGWVHGYIVGYGDFSSGISRLCDQTAVLGKAGPAGSNILLAATPDETDWEKCIPVNFQYDLPVGSGTIAPARNALNLNSNPRALFREVCLYGCTGFKYRTVYGLKKCVYYKYGAEGDPDVTPPDLTPVWQQQDSDDEE